MITNYPAGLMHLLCVFIPAYPTWSVDNKVRLLILKNGILVKVRVLVEPEMEMIPVQRQVYRIKL